MSEILTICNQKGGVGKTSSTVNIAGCLSQKGKTVLAIDLDSQASLTKSFGVKPDKGKTVFEVLQGKIDIEDAILESEGVSILPSSIKLAKAEMEFFGVPGGDRILAEVLSDQNFEYILIDCPPSLGLLTINAMAIADRILIALIPEYLALEGLSDLIDVINVVKRRLNSSLDIKVMITRYKHRNIDNEVIEVVRNQFDVFDTNIRENVAITEAQSYGQSIFKYDSKCNGAVDYRNLVEEILGE